MKKTRIFLLLIIISSLALFLGFIIRKPVPTQSQEINISQQSYTDGKYQGKATGFRPGLEVEITIKDGKLTKVDVLRHNEVGPQYWMRAISLIPQYIVKKQSPDVDTIGGATFTSNGIKTAVKNALKKAVKQ